MPYSDFNPPDSWYEPDCEETPADYGWVHEDDLPNFEHVKDMLQGMMECLYKTGDVSQLEDCLDELCHQFDLKLMAGSPVLHKKSDELSSNLFNLGIALSRAQAIATR